MRSQHQEGRRERTHEAGARQPLCTSEQERPRQASQCAHRELGRRRRPSHPPRPAVGGSVLRWVSPLEAWSHLRAGPSVPSLVSQTTHPGRTPLKGSLRNTDVRRLSASPAAHIHSRQARPPALSAHAPSAPRSREPAIFPPGKPRCPAPRSASGRPAPFCPCAQSPSPGGKKP